ncbi:MAG: hypothetical protein IJC59_07305 [Lachnospiraceae bacterium]|nr:hypothetical protein [Lachnospiraceae bacterium]
MKTFFQNFFYCGILGWCVEILFTAFQNFRYRNWKLQGTTSLWMFPIYGCGCALALPYRILKKAPAFYRGLSYMLLIFTGEYISGRLLTGKQACPWDYSASRYQIHNVIRLDYAPGWFCLGLLIERIFLRR